MVILLHQQTKVIFWFLDIFSKNGYSQCESKQMKFTVVVHVITEATYMTTCIYNLVSLFFLHDFIFVVFFEKCSGCIHLVQVGLITGKYGETIKYLQHQPGAKIQVIRDTYSNPTSLTRKVELMGTLGKIIRIKKLINDVIVKVFPIMYFDFQT